MRRGLSLALALLVPAALVVGSILLPLGFLLGGLEHHEGDPGIGIFLVPLGALCCLFAVGVQMVASWRRG